jgi:putative ABC transport system permease protein
VIFLTLEFEKESLRMAFDSIKERKLRSALTALGIIIGIAAIIALVSIGEGTNALVTQALGSLGANTIFVSSGGGGGGGFGGSQGVNELLGKKDLTDIQSTRGVEAAVGIFVKSMPATFKDETKRLNFYGVDTKEAQKFFLDIRAVEISQGRFFKSGEKHVVILGSNVASKEFDTPLKVNDKFETNGQKVQVIGILKETGQSTYDNIIIAPMDDVQQSSAGDQYLIIFARVSDPNRIDDIANSIQKKMDDLHGKKVFQVFTTKQLTEQIGTVTNTISLVLGGIAGISLLVAGIGIANTMLMSVMERTREIGIMKAIGASNRNILEIFLMESALIGLIGGVIGGIVGIGFSNVIGVVLRNYGIGFATKVTPELFLGGVGFSLIVGVIFGLLPARRAAKLQPVEALRYE